MASRLFAVVLASVLVSVCAPLLTYSLSLSLFGIAHVLSELRYVDQRFGKQIQGQMAASLVLLLVGIVTLRILNISGVLVPWHASLLEVILIFTISLYSIALVKTNPTSRLVALLFAAGIFWGLLTSPATTLLILAFAHNLTPIGFISEATPHSNRKSVLTLCIAIFALVPLAIMSGWPRDLLTPLLGIYPDVSVLPTGPLAAHLGVYLPQAIRNSDWAIDAFSAACFLQCMHYVAVIHVLPKLPRQAAPAQKTTGSWIPWPSGFQFGLMRASSSLIFALAFFTDFTFARGVYGIFAAVHAWLEIPLLMLAVASIAPQPKTQYA
jgi:hypothetical protein